MKELFRERDIARIAYYQSLLEAAGISTFVRNEHVANTAASIPEFDPALCVTEDSDYSRAVELIQSELEKRGAPSKVELTCTQCGEKNPGNFGSCWNCGAALGAES